MSVVDGEQVAGNHTLRADAVVIGSGAGGAPVAAELAAAGMRVVVLEEGPYVATAELTGRPRDMIQRLYRDAGQTVTVGNPPIPLPLGRAVGGTTLINSGTCFRPPAEVLAGWRDERGLDIPDGVFAVVEAEIGVGEVTPELAGGNAAIARRGAEALGWSGGFLRRNARGCVGSGVCAFGCPAGAKQHTALTFLARAQHDGAEVWAGTRATRVALRGRRAVGLEAATRGGGHLRIAADRIVVACGTVHTPLFLARQGLGRESGHLGDNLSLHPATAVLALFDEEIGLSRGVPQSYYVDEFKREGIVLEGVAGPPDYLATVLPFTGAEHRDLMLEHRRLAQFGLMIRDRSRGSVRERFGRPVIRYDLGREDVETLRKGLAALVELYGAAGARRVIVPVAALKHVAPGDGDAVRRTRLRARDLKLMAFHPLGTARADARPGHGVVDADLRVRGVEGVWVADGSVVPSAPGVNPQITIMALGVRLGRHLAGESERIESRPPRAA